MRHKRPTRRALRGRAINIGDRIKVKGQKGPFYIVGWDLRGNPTSPTYYVKQGKRVKKL